MTHRVPAAHISIYEMRVGPLVLGFRISLFDYGVQLVREHFETGCG